MNEDWQHKVRLRKAEVPPAATEEEKAYAQQNAQFALTKAGIAYCNDVKQNIADIKQFREHLYADLTGLKSAKIPLFYLDPLMDNAASSLEILNEIEERIQRMQNKLEGQENASISAKEFIFNATIQSHSIYRLRSLLDQWREGIVDLQEELEGRPKHEESERYFSRTLFMEKFEPMLNIVDNLSADLYASHAMAEKHIALYKNEAGLNGGTTR